MDTKEKILNSALKLFATKGYEATGVQEIVESAGITKPTLYHHFGNKIGLLETLLTQYNHRLNYRIDGAAKYDGDLRESLIEIVVNFFDFAKQNKDFYRLQLAMVFGPIEGEPISIVGRLASAPYESIQQCFVQAVTLEDDKRDEICMHYAITFIGIIHQYIALFLNGFIELSEEKVDSIVDCFLNGITT